VRCALRSRGDRGSVLVEFAFIVPILFLAILGLADFALAELSDTAGANAAREGGRVGILYFDGAHTVGSANHSKIVAAVEDKLAGNVEGSPTVTVRCLNPDGTARPSGGSCSTVSGDKVQPGKDLIEVQVRWTRKGGITGLIGSRERTDKAVMRIVGTPPTGAVSPPPACSITASSATPSTAILAAGVIPPVIFSVTVSDRAACGGVDLTFPAEAGYSGPQPMIEIFPGAATFEFILPTGQGGWTAGTKTVIAASNGGSVTRDITFEVASPLTCVLTVTSPVTAQQSGGKLTGDATFTASVSSLAACGSPTITFPASTGIGSSAMSLVTGTTFRFTVAASQGTWSAQTYLVTVTASGGATAPIGFIVSDQPACMLTNLLITPSSAPVKKNGQEEIEATVVITVVRTLACATPTVTVTPGASGPAGGGADLTTPKPMSCVGLACQYVIPSGTRNWYPDSGVRTVTVMAGLSMVSGQLTLT
jgi:hypothetical protein